MALVKMRESLCMPASYTTDITETANKSIQESVKSLNSKSRIIESKQDINRLECMLRESNVETDIVKKVIDRLRNEGVETSKHKIYRVPVARFGNLNGNHRRYPEELWVNVMNNQQDAWKGLAGLADHPEDDNDPGSFKDSSIVWLGMEIDRPNKLVYGIGSFVGPYGHLAQEIIDCGGRVGFSSSGFGELMNDKETVNPDTYQIERLADVVLNPSQSVYGVIGDEANNIEYAKQTVKESLSYTNLDTIQENTKMEKNVAVSSAFNKVQEKELRKHINQYLKENTEMLNPYQQKKDLQEILELVQEGQLLDLESIVKSKLEEAEQKIEEAVEKAISMKESEISVESPDGTTVTVKTEEPSVPVTASIEEPSIEEPIVSETDIDVLEESRKLSKSEEKALRTYIMNFLNESHDSENPLEVLAHLDEALSVVKNGQLSDLEPSVIKALEEQKIQIQKDIIDAQKMKEELGSKDIAEITSTTKKIMETGSILADQVSDYKSLCEALTTRNQSLTKEYSAIKAKLDLREAQEEKKLLERNQKIVSTENSYRTLQKEFENYKKSMESKLGTYREAALKYSKGNAELEKKNGVIATKYKTLKEAFEKIITEKESLTEKLASTKTYYENKIKTANDSYKSLKEAFNEVMEDIENNDITSSKLVKATESLQALKTKFISYKESTKNKISELNEEISSLKESSKKEINSLTKKLNVSNKALKESEDANEEVDVLYSRISSLEDRLEDANGIINELKAEIDKLHNNTTTEDVVGTDIVEETPIEESPIEDVEVETPSEEEEPTTDEVLSAMDAETTEEIPAEEVTEPTETEGEDISLEDSLRDSEIEGYWQDLVSKYGEAVKPYEKDLRYASSFREAQINWLGIMSKVDESLISFTELSNKPIVQEVNTDTTYSDFLKV